MEMMRDCNPSFVITDVKRVDDVLSAVSASQTDSVHPALNLTVRANNMT